MLSVFQRAANGILAVMGEDAVLRSTVPCKVNIEHGVETYGPDGEVIVLRSIATISAGHDPRVGDYLEHPDGNFKLDAPFQSNGASPRFVLVRYAPP